MFNIISKEVFLKEMFRKGIHVSSFLFPLLYHFTNKNLMLILIITFSLLMIIIEYSRFMNIKLYQFIQNNVFRFLKIDLSQIIRRHEAHNLTGASYMAISMLICLIFFSKAIVITAFSILAISDTLAALIGMRFGKIKLLDKTLEGCIAFFISSMLICYTTTIIYDVIFTNHQLCIFFICFIITITELISKKLQLDDNLSIPLIFCIIVSTIDYL